jgi:O-acetyl-ADP-ribose deacetylase (regulator of RNase III)
MQIDGRRNNDDFMVPDRLLVSAYQRSLNRCKEHGITDVAFALLSAGIFRGRQSMQNVLALGIRGIQDWVKLTDNVGYIKTVTLCGFSEKEATLLLNVSEAILGRRESAEIRTEDDNRDGQCDEVAFNEKKPTA